MAENRRGVPIHLMAISKRMRYQCQNFRLLFLARLFSKKTSRYCHSPSVGGGIIRHPAKTLTFSNISVITEDIYLKLSVVVHRALAPACGALVL